MLLLAVTPNVPFTYPIGILVGFSSIAFMTTSTAIVQLRSDPSMRGRVLALQAMVFLGSTPIGGPILGYICQHFGARSGVVVGEVAMFPGGSRTAEVVAEQRGVVLRLSRDSIERRLERVQAAHRYVQPRTPDWIVQPSGSPGPVVSAMAAQYWHTGGRAPRSRSRCLGMIVT